MKVVKVVCGNCGTSNNLNPEKHRGRAKLCRSCRGILQKASSKWKPNVQWLEYRLSQRSNRIKTSSKPSPAPRRYRHQRRPTPRILPPMFDLEKGYRLAASRALLLQMEMNKQAGVKEKKKDE